MQIVSSQKLTHAKFVRTLVEIALAGGFFSHKISNLYFSPYCTVQNLKKFDIKGVALYEA